jgi:protein-L-isoaspartate(D-aspartate) O-methyltransferase
MDPERMIAEIRRVYGLDSPLVFSAMLRVPREEFVPGSLRDRSYDDAALLIGFGQTISQPYTVAFMTDLLNLKGREKVLEIGTGSGYQAAILSLLTDKIFTIERIPELAEAAKSRFEKLGYKNIYVRTGSGEAGWKEESPFDSILVTAGMEKVPDELFDQLKFGGILVAPIGKGIDKEMMRFIKKKTGVKEEKFGVFNFVPFVENN